MENNKIKLFERITLTEDIGEFEVGDVGIVVEIYGNHEGYEVEILNAQSDTLDVITVFAHQIRAVEATDVLHLRQRA